MNIPTVFLLDHKTLLKFLNVCEKRNTNPDELVEALIKGWSAKPDLTIVPQKKEEPEEELEEEEEQEEETEPEPPKQPVVEYKCPQCNRSLTSLPDSWFCSSCGYNMKK
jgi:hypothetical protein